jgi:hypothetical protein
VAKRKSDAYKIVDGLIEPEEGEDSAYELDVRANMDARLSGTAHDWSLELNGIEDELAAVRAAEKKLNAKKEAIQRLITRWLTANNVTSAALNGYTYSETFKPVAKVVSKAELRKYCLDNGFEDMLTVNANTLNSWVGDAVLKAAENFKATEHSDALAALGIEAGDTRGKENLGPEGRKQAFIAMLAKVMPSGVQANARTSLGRTKSSRS